MAVVRLKEEERRRLEAFAIGWVMGTQQKHEQAFDEDSVNWFSYMTPVAVLLASGDDVSPHGLSSLLGQFSLPEGDDLYDSVVKRLECDAHIDRISDLTGKVIKRGPGEVTLDKVFAEALRDELNSYLDSLSDK